MFEIRIINFKTSLNLPVKIDFTWKLRRISGGVLIH